MKSNLFFFVFFLLFLFAENAVCVNSTLSADADTTEVLSKIVKHTDEIVRYTKPSSLFGNLNWNDWYALLIAVFALVVSLKALYWTERGAKWQRDSEENTRAIRQIQKEQQGFLLLDFIRHLYRNKVVICALQWRLDGNYETHYPFDEHILKLQIPMDELQLDKFANSSSNFDNLHKLKLMCRNVNIEIGVAYEHLKTKGFPTVYKEYDLKVLEFKCQLITKHIIRLMYQLGLFSEERWDKEINESKCDGSLGLPFFDDDRAIAGGNDVNIAYLKKVRSLLFNRIQDNKHELPLLRDYLGDASYRYDEDKFERRGVGSGKPDRYRYYDDVLQIGEQLSYDIYIEGKGKNGGEGVIKMIKF